MMRRLAFVMAGVTSVAAVTLLPVLTWVYRGYLVGQTIVGFVIAATLLGCALVFVIGATRIYEFNFVLVPIVGFVGLAALVVFSWTFMLLDLLLLVTIIVSGLAMNRGWRTEAFTHKLTADCC
jgi:hypothetical protein